VELARYQPMSDRLVALLQLGTAPVAVQFCRDVPDDIPRAEADLKGCMYLDTARHERRVFYADGANLAPCPGGRYYLGQGAPFPSLLDGTFPSGNFPEAGLAVFGNPGAVRETLRHYAIMPEGKAQAICYGPLDMVDFDPADGPIAIIVFCVAKTAMYLTRAATYETGGIVPGPIGPPTCASVMVQPVRDNQAVYTLGCFGFRRYVKIGVEEVVVGLPIDMLAPTVANIERFFTRRPDIEAALPLCEAVEAPTPLAPSTKLGALYQRMFGETGAP
jgi:uncharacterized protein (DUF169 family)